ncbi:Gmad2 immunoglobulin-like domain-containing protein [Tepidiforma sp.]|uniref:Gmad2 immunoglobulin-like domain-containing protein n=1 Tax=Tepidiforma sp. TaxID=2682230 RepID=UPI002ADDA8C3|nr:Gmad2 immunoglobulin-like domain-containing protein [Tepidiforma sp.]
MSQPLPNASVTSPLTVTGMVEAFEATFQAQLVDGNANQLAHVVGMAQQGQVLSPFSVQLTFSVSAPTPACLRIYQQSAKDGSDSKIVQVPLVLLP